MGDPDRTARAAGRDRRQAGGAVPRRAHVAAGRWADPLPAVERETEGQEVRAVVHDRYGPPEVLRIGDVERPVPGDEEILVRVHATTVNRTDCGWRSGSPFFVRYFTGVRRPKWRTLGMEFAGEVEAVGSVVTRVRRRRPRLRRARATARTRSSSACARGRRHAHAGGMSFEEAAAICDGACIALSCLRKADLREGRSIVVYGASGSVGTAAVQLAQALRGSRHRRVQHEERRARALARRRRGHRLRARGLHEERQDLRRDLRRSRQALVSAVPTLARSPTACTSRPTSGSCGTSRSSRSRASA